LKRKRKPKDSLEEEEEDGRRKKRMALEISETTVEAGYQPYQDQLVH